MHVANGSLSLRKITETEERRTTEWPKYKHAEDDEKKEARSLQ